MQTDSFYHVQHGFWKEIKFFPMQQLNFLFRQVRWRFQHSASKQGAFYNPLPFLPIPYPISLSACLSVCFSLNITTFLENTCNLIQVSPWSCILGDKYLRGPAPNFVICGIRVWQTVQEYGPKLDIGCSYRRLLQFFLGHLVKNILPLHQGVPKYNR